MERKPSEIDLESDEAQLARDLQKYPDKALELGAARVKIVRTDEILVDERVTLECQIPRCFGYGAGANCPPNTLKPAQLRGLLEKYKWAVFFVKEVPSNIIVRDKATIKERVAAYQDVHKIVTEIESMAFYHGIIWRLAWVRAPADTHSAAWQRIALP